MFNLRRVSYSVVFKTNLSARRILNTKDRIADCENQLIFINNNKINNKNRLSIVLLDFLHNV